MESKCWQLVQCNKISEAYTKMQQMFHMHASYSVITMFKNEELFQYMISKTMEMYRNLLANKIVPFDLKWDKQVIMYILLALSFCKVNKHK